MVLEEDHVEGRTDVLLELRMNFDTENDVREYYKNTLKKKIFSVTRSSNRDDNGELKYLTLCCSSLPSGSSSAMVMAPMLGKYTSMLLQVQQSSDALSNSADLHFNAIGRIDDTLC